MCCAQAGWYGNKLMAGYRAKAPRQRLKDCRHALAQDSLPPDTLAELQPFLDSQQLLILSHTAICSITTQQSSSGSSQTVTCAAQRPHAQAAQQVAEFRAAWGGQSVSSSDAGSAAAEGRDADLSGLASQPDALPASGCGSGPAVDTPGVSVPAPAKGHLWSFSADQVWAVPVRPAAVHS